MTGMDLEAFVNRQGARIVNLEQQLAEQQTIILYLAGRVGSTRFPKREREKLSESVEAIGWDELKDGTLVFKVKTSKGAKP